MKERWEYSTIGDLCDKLNGLWKGKKGPFVNVGVIRNANFTKDFTLSFENIEYLDVEAKQYETRKLQKGDLIVEKSGGSEKQPVGRTVLFNKEDGEYSFSNFTSVLRIKDKSIITPEFLYKYILFVYMRGDTRKMQKATTGIHNIEFDKFLSILVPFISLSEQQSIVDYLDSAFVKIDAMKANAEKALNEAKALFQASLKEMLEPKEGWEEKKLDDIGELKNGMNFNKNESGYNIHILGVGDFGNLFQIDDTDYLQTISLNSNPSEEYILKNEDIVFVRSNGNKNLVGRCVLIHVGDEPCSFSGFCIRFRKSTKEVDACYLTYFLKTEESRRKLVGNGANISNLNQKVLNEFVVSYPSMQEQQSIVATLDSLKSKVDRLQENYDKISQECDALKQAILRQVFE